MHEALGESMHRTSAPASIRAGTLSWSLVLMLRPPRTFSLSQKFVGVLLMEVVVLSEYKI